jgi:hypothetical protein
VIPRSRASGLRRWDVDPRRPPSLMCKKAAGAVFKSVASLKYFVLGGIGELKVIDSEFGFP